MCTRKQPCDFSRDLGKHPCGGLKVNPMGGVVAAIFELMFWGHREPQQKQNVHCCIWRYEADSSSSDDDENEKREREFRRGATWLDRHRPMDRLPRDHECGL
jgi:hypothetical protein